MEQHAAAKKCLEHDVRLEIKPANKCGFNVRVKHPRREHRHKNHNYEH